MGVGSFNMTPLLKTTEWWVWSDETKESSSAWFFLFFYGGDEYCSSRGLSSDGRDFAVRSRK
jgi:hypothetical protein